MLRNGRNGFVLVFVLLAFFLRLRLAFWVSIGVPLSILGALALFPYAGVSINVLSLFAFILVLGPNHKRARFPKLARAVTGSTDISEVPARRVIDPYARKERIKDHDVAVSRTHRMDYEPELVSFVASRPQLQQRAWIHDPRGGLTHHRRWT